MQLESQKLWYISVYIKIQFDRPNKDGGKASREYETYFILNTFISRLMHSII